MAGQRPLDMKLGHEALEEQKEPRKYKASSRPKKASTRQPLIFSSVDNNHGPSWPKTKHLLDQVLEQS